MITLIRTTAQNTDFIALVQKLDAGLAVIDGDEHTYYAQYNKIDGIKYAVVAYVGKDPVGCGAIKEFDPQSVEVKRMYTEPACRGEGIATRVLGELEQWAAEMGYETCMLETGKRQPDAIALYQKNGYVTTPNYGQYLHMENSVCFEKAIR